MTTPPRRDEDDLHDTLRRIRVRRRRIGHVDVDGVGDSALEMWDYLRKHSGRGIPLWVRQAEAVDVLRLRVCLSWQAERMELWAWDRADECGVAHRDMGAEVGVRSRSGCRFRHDRKIALLASPDGRPDHRVARAARNPTAEDLKRERVVAGWLKTHEFALQAVCRELIEFEPHVEDELAGLLRNLWRDYLQPGLFTPGLMGSILVIAGELNDSASVQGIADQQHSVLRALARWADLYADWHALTRDHADDVAG